MARSLAAGHYSLLMAIESSSRPDSWYRICQDRNSSELSCDCPSWIYSGSQRSCKHTRIAQLLLMPASSTTNSALAVTGHPFIDATREQWPGLGGTWSIQERDSRIGNDAYHFVLLTLHTGNGEHIGGCAAFAHQHQAQRSMVPGVACWIGYAISAEVCRRAICPWLARRLSIFVCRSAATIDGLT
jgi:hypothetical protein